MFNLDDCLAFITNRSGKIFAEALENEFRPSRITRSQWIAMYYIYTNESITQRELADKMAIKEPSVVRLLQKLEFENLLYRSGSNTDKRIKQLELTAKGQQICLALIPTAESFKNYTVRGIPEEDLQTFQRVLNTMIHNTIQDKMKKEN
ncbi:DNA-binding MarR family transcriptional regulator [Fontibacillus solani]|uniref:DNA-binding MarR family transcriptional regulator n=1 Tax=Fontibacillus solani TaxID=1572857 RepID=A0A7W3XQC4_9BACL|nr:MarR family transcriptional regulator [Fontibacillus solani]MBA9084334.1 DNA-binding MarR family transcriptional regulator [Fontibacillus solani]